MSNCRSTMVLAVSVVLAVAVAQVQACCGVAGAGRSVVFGDQTNIVIWNAETHTEHFIRKANFRTEGSDFGFIAPTPSKPDLYEVSGEAFYTLAALRPAEPAPATAGAMAVYTKAMPKVDVVQVKDVAGYHATTLLANDASALGAWMDQHGYKSTPGIQDWTKPYIAKGWYLTAFKVLNQGEVATTGTIRMSFKADKPFNPFFVPKDNLAAGQRGGLKVYFVSAGDYEAQIGSSEPWQDSSWSARIPDETAGTLASQLNLSATEIPDGAQVAEFEDPDFPREASDDIYFTKRPSRLLSISATAASTIAVVVLLIRGRMRGRSMGTT